MADNSSIEWLRGGATWNFMDAINIETNKVGFFCEKIAPECKFCYAEKMNVNTYFGNGIRYAVDQRGKVRITLNERKLNKPLHWRKPRLIFPCSMTDLFGAWVPDEWIDAAYDVMDKASQHIFLVLTKRPGRRMEYLRKRYATSPPAKHIWEGTSCGLQETADEFIPLLLQTPATVRWVSAEPLLGPLNIRGHLMSGSSPAQCKCGHGHGFMRCPNYGGVAGSCHATGCDCKQFQRVNFELGWVVAGGESGQNARPMHPDWARSLRDQCQAAGVPFFFKQWGEWLPYGENEPITHIQDAGREKWYVGRNSHNPSDRITLNSVEASTVTNPVIHKLHSRFQVEVFKVGKKAAGRLLDGKEHNEYPEVRP